MPFERPLHTGPDLRQNGFTLQPELAHSNLAGLLKHITSCRKRSSVLRLLLSSIRLRGEPGSNSIRKRSAAVFAAGKVIAAVHARFGQQCKTRSQFSFAAFSSAKGKHNLAMHFKHSKSPTSPLGTESQRVPIVRFLKQRLLRRRLLIVAI